MNKLRLVFGHEKNMETGKFDCAELRRTTISFTIDTNQGQ